MKKSKKVAKAGKTLVSFILDKSGSMQSVKDATISGFNEYIQTLKKSGGEYEFSLSLFDTEISILYTDEPIKNVKELNAEVYSPDGSTALYDAVCKTVNEVEKKVTNQKVLVVIMTDGEENASKEYDQEAMRSKIKELEKTGKWSFIYLGANQDSYANAAKFGVSQMNTTNFQATNAGVKATMRSMATNTVSFASASNTNTAAFFTQADQQNLAAGMDAQTANKVSQHFSNMGNKSWEARKKKFLEE